MILTSRQTQPSPTTAKPTVNLRCPRCGKRGTFEPAQDVPDMTFAIPVDKPNTVKPVSAGHRFCPDKECKTHIFFVIDDTNNQLLVSYPAERIDFDTRNIPASLVSAFEEAITCHANQCFVASAIMVRKTLELLCLEQGASGKDLHARIQDLRSKVLLPKELLDGLDELRLLGNDAAHIESKTYNNIGREELEVAIEFTKEVLKAVYQYQALLDRIKALKAASP
ncbi:MAG: DUF4145 domain-containing protein [Chloroflexi bacterium]|nr:DUF4145 domain-containing protein [Chloroflexota bacterium]